MIKMSPQVNKEPQQIVPVEQEPMHKQRWISDRVRMVSAEFPPFTACGWHRHQQLTIYICVTPLYAYEESMGNEPMLLEQPKGAVFCRDHREDIHTHAADVGETLEHPLQLVMVEILPNDKLTQAVAYPEDERIETLFDRAECLVHRLTLKDQDSISLPLGGPESVLVALEDCAVSIESNDKNVESKQQLQAGDELKLPAGRLGLTLERVESGVNNSADFVLVQVL